MSDWSYLSKLLHKVQAHSTVVGKIWMSVLFLFRIFVLGAAADNVWGDELSEFYCDSKEPGCKNSCYNWMFPMSYVHYWVLQITFVSTPTLVYLGHAVLIIHKEKKMIELEQNKKNGNAVKTPKYTDERGKVKIKEKTIFIFFMLAVSGVSVLLNIVEIVYLLCNKVQSAKRQLALQSHVLTAKPCTPTEPAWGAMRNQYGGYPLLPVHSHVTTCFTSDDSHIHSE
ncbi:gap junction Cx32.2 protein-like isoform X2 [Syngnathoides biaculeatus]|uniref:gap junction Cx32.2 protein-like isoform X2 n=1 Tax=Syngnathoides biaculeatus TaxID=300417 RepID=UPI002ADE7B68|nr:gap junction Cx32.2 protein-like isoform X2 [Syngnathoides biaculeatus]